jgi:hypothetical protein
MYVSESRFVPIGSSNANCTLRDFGLGPEIEPRPISVSDRHFIPNALLAPACPQAFNNRFS